MKTWGLLTAILLGSNFRANDCQYIYNLGVSLLGVGTYQVNIGIGGSGAGTATFGLTSVAIGQPRHKRFVKPNPASARGGNRPHVFGLPVRKQFENACFLLTQQPSAS